MVGNWGVSIRCILKKITTLENVWKQQNDILKSQPMVEMVNVNVLQE